MDTPPPSIIDADRQPGQKRAVSSSRALLSAYQASSLVLGTAFCGFFAAHGAWLSFVGPAGFMVLVALSIACSRTGKTTRAAQLISIALWAAPTWSAFTTGGLNSPLMMWFTPHIFMTAALLGWRWAIAAGAMSLLATGAMLPFDDFIAELSEFPAGLGSTLFSLLCAGSAILLIVYYGILFSTQADRAQARLLAMQTSLRHQKDALDVHSLVAITDAKGLITVANDMFCSVSQYSREELIGKDHRILNSGHHPSSFWAEAWRTIGGGDVWRGEVKNRAKDGSHYWVDTTIVPVKDHEDRVEGYISIRTDITGRKNAEQAALDALNLAEHAAEAKSSFLATMSHEIRTPMNGVSGMAHLLSKTTLSVEQQQYLDALNTSSSALLTLIDDILDYSKIEAGKLEIDLQPFAVRDLTEGVSELMGLKAQEEGLEFAVIVDRSVPHELIGDQGRLRQILVNLANNAVKFTDQGSVILNVQCMSGCAGGCDLDGDGSEGTLLHFSITDTGIGMPPDVVDKLFTPFTQADSSTTRKFGGTGLGLSICKQLCDLMGGDLTVRSEPGVGSTFGVTIRLGHSNPEHRPRVPGGFKVLLVSKVCPGSEQAEECLGFLGAEVHALPGAAEALDYLKENAGGHSAVVYRPGPTAQDTPAVVKQLQQAAGQRSTPLIVLLSLGHYHEARVLTDLGVQAVLCEPVRVSKLQAALEPTKAASDQVHAEESEGLTGNVLLVDDNKINRIIASRMLTNLGLKVSMSENGEEALKAIAENEFDLVLMDCQMPVMDGYEATRAQRVLEESSGSRRMPIVALTAGVMKSDREACYDSGMDDYLTKPIVVEALEKALSKYLSPKRQTTPGEATGGPTPAP